MQGWSNVQFLPYASQQGVLGAGLRAWQGTDEDGDLYCGRKNTIMTLEAYQDLSLRFTCITYVA